MRDHDDDENRSPRFDTTKWAMIHDPDARGKFCGRYWYPIYAFIRRSGHSPHDAEELTQGFFLKFIMEKNILSTADPGKGRLQDYLKICVKYFLHDERYLCEPTDDLSPDRCYDRAWAVSVLAEIMRIVDQKYARLGGDHHACYLALRPLLDETKAQSDDVEKVAAALGVPPAYVVNRKFKLRAEWKKTAREVVKKTLHDATDEDAVAELRRLVVFLQEDRQTGRSRK